MRLVRGKYTSLLLVAVVCLCASVASADRLNLSHPHYPLVASDFIQVDYDADGGAGGMGLLTAVGYAADLQEFEGDSQIIDGDFILTVVINPTTGAGISGELVVSEWWDVSSDLFYSADLTAFGWGTLEGDDVFEATFIQDGNMMASDGDDLGVILALASIDAPWDFSQDFSNSGYGTSQSFYMPEPTTMIVMSIAGIGLLRRRRR